MLLVKSLICKEIARPLIITLSTELSIVSNLIIASVRDHAGVNIVCTLGIIFLTILDRHVVFFSIHLIIWESIQKLLFLITLWKVG